jgi:prepilin-type N-terminal cleavage/methylation domain-containing protein
MHNSIKRGFTLIEILIVIGLIAILAAIVIIAINPTRQFGQATNAQRRSDVNTILNAVYQYAIDHNGQLTAEIPSTLTEICKTGVASSTCTAEGLINLGNITAYERYIVSMPIDANCPTGCSTNGTGYRIATTTNSRVIVDAPGAQLGETISVSR